MIRPNLIGVWIVLCIANAVTLSRQRGTRSLFEICFIFFLGTGTIVFPFIAWLWLNGAYENFIDSYILFNLRYCAGTGNQAASFLETLLAFMNIPTVIICISASLLMLWKFGLSEEGSYLASMALSIISLILVCMSGRQYMHYGIALIPSVTLVMSQALGYLPWRRNSGVRMLACVYLAACVAYPSWAIMAQNAIGDVRQNASISHDDTTAIVEAILAYSADDEPIVVYSNWDYLYLETQRASATKYSYQPGGVSEHSGIMEEFYSELEEKKPKLIVVSAEKVDEQISGFLLRNNYDQVLSTSTADVYVSQ